MLKVAVLGAAGRMGQAVLECIAAADDLELAGAVTEPGDPALGKDAGENAGLPAAGVFKKFPSLFPREINVLKALLLKIFTPRSKNNNDESKIIMTS